VDGPDFATWSIASPATILEMVATVEPGAIVPSSSSRPTGTPPWPAKYLARALEPLAGSGMAPVKYIFVFVVLIKLTNRNKHCIQILYMNGITNKAQDYQSFQPKQFLQTLNNWKKNCSISECLLSELNVLHASGGIIVLFYCISYFSTKQVLKGLNEKLDLTDFVRINCLI
jgi:hypothetical protein